MTRTVELDSASERRLDEWAKALGVGSGEEALTVLTRTFLRSLTTVPNDAAADFVLAFPDRRLSVKVNDRDGVEPIRFTENVMGGDACVRDTRIPVWTLVDYKRQNLTDADLLAAFPGINTADLTASWDYYAAHSQEVDAQRRRHEEAE